MFLSIFNSSPKKFSNLESSFLINDTSWKNKTLIISTQTFRMVTNLSKTFLQTQSFFIVWNQKQIKGKEVTKLQKVEQKFYPEYKSYIKLHIAAVILHHLFSLNPLISTYCHQEQPLDPSVFAEPNYLFTQHLPCSLPCDYVTSLLSYSRQ